MRLLCDAMLAGLARWLRAAGYDTALVPPGASDARVLGLCGEEHRVLVSRDRTLVAHAGREIRTVLLTGDDLTGHARTLAARLGLDWTYAPFTRCMVDNTPLRAAASDELDQIPPRSRALPGPFRTCPACGRVFWPGSHARRMMARLQYWRSLGEPAQPP
ncbi:MAG: Mut7-C RNAse domain-containing protein [Acetobacteraceae bacterium]|nr:Mut7-C RNAse domain-containing protein [Acetobacteraceae bacterium]